MEEDEETKLRHNVEDAFSEAVEALHELAETLEAVNWQWEAGVTLQEAAAEAAKCNPGAGAITKLADDGILGVSVANICKAIKAANEYNAQQYPDYAGALAEIGVQG